VTLHDNPRVDAEKRIKQLYKRLDNICYYKASRIEIYYKDGLACRIGIDPYIKVNKAGRIIKELHKQIRKTEKILKSFL